jgi:hypothetical protein
MPITYQTGIPTVAEHVLARQQRQEVAALDGALRGRVEHPGLRHADTQREQREPHTAADVVGVPPVRALPDRGNATADDARRDAAADTDARDDRGRDAAPALVHELADQRDASAELTGEADARDHAAHAVLLDRGHGAVREVRERVRDDRAEQHGQPAALVAENAPQDPADDQAAHLQLEQEQALARQLVSGRVPELDQARIADRPEQDQVVDVDEVTEGGDDHRQRCRALRLHIRVISKG